VESLVTRLAIMLRRHPVVLVVVATVVAAVGAKLGQPHHFKSFGFWDGPL